MKLITLFSMLLFSTMIMAQYDSFSIRVSGSNTNHSATFYNNKLLYGLDFARFSMNYETSEEDYDSDGYLTRNSSDGGISINIFMPRIGFKMPAKSMGKVNTYNQIEGYLVIPMVKGKDDLEDVVDEVDEEIEDALSLFGIKISHAVEYEFSEQLSLTASVGLNLIFWDFSIKSTNQSSYYADGGNYYNNSSKQKLSVNLGYTYTMLALHYQLKN